MGGGAPVSARVMTALLVVMVATALTGCGGPDVTFVSDGGAYTLEQVEDLHASEAPPSSLEGSPVSEASEHRRDALVELRSRGGEAAELAEFITRSLADTGRSVPYFGEAATVEDVPAWILIEVWGTEGSTLDYTRLWVFDRRDGAVVYSSTSR